MLGVAGSVPDNRCIYNQYSIVVKSPSAPDSGTPDALYGAATTDPAGKPWRIPLASGKSREHPQTMNARHSELTPKLHRGAVED